MDKLKQLTEQIWERRGLYAERPFRLTPELVEELERVDIKDVLVYAFTRYFTTSIKDFFLLVSPFWLRLTYEDWQQVFAGIKGKRLGEYYMAVIAARYLGIDPKYRSTRNISVGDITFADNKMYHGKPATFVGHAQGSLRELLQEELQQVGLSIEVLEKYSGQLLADAPEKNRVGKPRIENREQSNQVRRAVDDVQAWIRSIFKAH